MLCNLGDIGQFSTGSWWYRLGSGVEVRRAGGDGERMG
jgi:hypothetical protein